MSIVLIVLAVVLIGAFAILLWQSRTIGRLDEAATAEANRAETATQTAVQWQATYDQWAKAYADLERENKQLARENAALWPYYQHSAQAEQAEQALALEAATVYADVISGENLIVNRSGSIFDETSLDMPLPDVDDDLSFTQQWNTPLVIEEPQQPNRRERRRRERAGARS